MTLKVTMDGVIFETQRFGGISRMYEEVLPRVCRSTPPVQITLMMNKFAGDRGPTASCIERLPIATPERFLRPGRLFGRIHPRLRATFARRQISGHEASIWHSTYYTHPTRWSGPIVTTVFDMIHERFAHLFTAPWDQSMRNQKRRCVVSSDLIIAISEATKVDVVNHYGVSPERVRVLHLAAGSAFEQEGNEVSHWRRPYLLYVGGRNHYKNFGILLHAYGRWNGNASHDLLIAGPPQSASERKILKDFRLQEKVTFIEHPSDQLLASLYRHSIALVYPSLYEGFGIPLLEAMRTDCPVIASRIPTSIEVAGDAAIYFDPDDSDGLVEALDAVTEPATRDCLREKGRRRANLFSWEEAARKLVEAYRAAGA